jgi:hypothetical protein
MNDMKKSNITRRIRNAWQALRDKPYKTLTVGVDVIRCSECGYYKAAHEPAEITLAAPPAKYYHEIEYLENVVLVILYEATETGPVEIARSHGHIIHEGVAGIAQAASYAMKGVWYKIQD